MQPGSSPSLCANRCLLRPPPHFCGARRVAATLSMNMQRVLGTAARAPTVWLPTCPLHNIICLMSPVAPTAYTCSHFLTPPSCTPEQPSAIIMRCSATLCCMTIRLQGAHALSQMRAPHVFVINRADVLSAHVCIVPWPHTKLLRKFVAGEHAGNPLHAPGARVRGRAPCGWSCSFDRVPELDTGAPGSFQPGSTSEFVAQLSCRLL